MSTLTTLAAHLDTECPYDWRITVADNGSTDRDVRARDGLRRRATRGRGSSGWSERGRGRALKQAWSTSTSEIVVPTWMSISPPGSSRCDHCSTPSSRAAAKSRSARGSLRAPRSPEPSQREMISRTYNVLARAFLHYGIVDAQCGFKAIRASLARDLIPKIEDNGWFFDTELLALAYRSGARINEVPVRWIEDHDSRVKIVKTATDDLKGIWRLWRDGRRNGTGGVVQSRDPGGDSLPSASGGGGRRRLRHARHHLRGHGRPIGLLHRERRRVLRTAQGGAPRGDRPSTVGLAARPRPPRRRVRNGDD